MEKARRAIRNGSALEKFRAFVEGQGGDGNIVEDFSLLPQSSVCIELEAWQDGYVSHMDAMKIGLASQHTGAGREKKDDVIDLSAGIVLCRKPGQQVKKGDVICRLLGSDAARLEKALEEARGAVEISSDRPEHSDLVKKIIR